MPIVHTPGTYVRELGNVTVALTKPAVSVGDLLILHFGHPNNATQAAATYTFPGDFTARYADSVSNTRSWIRWRQVDGTEPSSWNVTVSGGNGSSAHAGVLHAFSGVEMPPTFEGEALSTTTGTTISDADITTIGPDRLCLQFVTQPANAAIQEFSGETGGNWTILSQTPETGSGRIGIQSATLASAGTIGGGSYTASAAVGIVRGFALVPAAAGQPIVKRHGGVPFVRINSWIW